MNSNLRKRRRDLDTDFPGCHHEKRHRALKLDRPPQYWDTLSAPRLSRQALKELERRQGHTETKSQFAEDVLATPSDQDLTPRLRRATHGGPDLSELRGYLPPTITRTTPTRSSRRRKRTKDAQASHSSSSSIRSSSTTTYSANFEQKMIDASVYPPGYLGPDGKRNPKPRNIDEIRSALSDSRSSLSPTKFSEEDFVDFVDLNDMVTSETTAMSSLIPIIAGAKDARSPSSSDVVFNRLDKFDSTLSAAKPDKYYGARPAQIDRRVRDALAKYIVPNSDDSRPAAPNYFLEGKSASGRPDIARRQAMYDAALGARGIFYLQNYAKTVPVWDGHAYTLVSTYQPGTGSLHVYATHPAPSGDTGASAYYMTQVRAYAMTDSRDSFRNGAAAFRNARDWAAAQRDQAIEDANTAARKLETESSSLSKTATASGSNISAEACVSETSEDELSQPPLNKQRRR